MRKIIKKKRFITINNKLNQKTIGLILINQYNNIYNKKKPILVNNTNFFLQNNKFNIYNNKNLDEIIKINKIKKINIIEKIHIYNKNNLDLYIIILKNKELDNYKNFQYLDLYNNNNNNNNTIYQNILNFNKSKKNYLYNKIYSCDNNINLNVRHIYYHLIGYI